MIVQVTNTYELDTETGIVSNLQSFVNGVEKKAVTTRAKKDKAPPVLEDEALITLDVSKFTLNNRAVSIMGIEYQDRLVIKYQKVNGGKTLIPIIGKDVDQGAEGSGNKVTKTNTVACRGNGNTILSEHGTIFGLEEYKPGLWKMVSKNAGEVVAAPTTYKAVQDEAENLDVTIMTDDNDATEIGEMTFTL